MPLGLSDRAMFWTGRCQFPATTHSPTIGNGVWPNDRNQQEVSLIRVRRSMVRAVGEVFSR